MKMKLAKIEKVFSVLRTASLDIKLTLLLILYCLTARTEHLNNSLWIENLVTAICEVGTFAS